MKYLSIDIEATGLDSDCHIIEYAMVPINAEQKTIEHNLSYHSYIKCPSFESLKPNLNEWVIQHNQKLIEKAHKEGLELNCFKQNLLDYFSREDIKNYFNNERIVLFGKSLSAIDLPFLTRDLSKEFMDKYFSHKTLDLTSFCYGLIDLNILSKDQESSDSLSEFFNMGIVDHTALEDAIRMAQIYFKLLELCKKHLVSK